MRRRVQGLHDADQYAAAEISDGLYLVRVDRAQYRWHGQKPYYLFRFTMLEPRSWAGRPLTGSPLLHPESPVETDLVSARLRL
jgi:hypothetical protein